MDVSLEKAIVMGSFDDLRSSDIRFLEEASRIGKVHVLLWSDELVQTITCNPPKFSLDERLYLLNAIRYIEHIRVIKKLQNPNGLPNKEKAYTTTWVVKEEENSNEKQVFCDTNRLRYKVINSSIIKEFPYNTKMPVHQSSGRKRVVVTGCYDWFHSGHVRFFEEASTFGDLYVIAGSDENVRLLKGEGHPMFTQEERWYVVQSIRFVKQALISSGSGWMDAEPEIARIHPDIYLVNEDGDKLEKRNFCLTRQIEYIVLKRVPKEGLPRRQSVDLRGY
jgi:cytidyltransferase-like protein